jgi:hypothetical protein
MDIYKSRERGREDVSINTGNIEALALSGDMRGLIRLPDASRRLIILATAGWPGISLLRTWTVQQETMD